MPEAPAMAAAKEIITRCASPPSDSPALNAAMAAARDSYTSKPWRVAHILARSKLPSLHDPSISGLRHTDALIELSTALIEAAEFQTSISTESYLPRGLSDGEKEEYHDTVAFEKGYAEKKKDIGEKMDAVRELFEETMIDVSPPKGKKKEKKVIVKEKVGQGEGERKEFFVSRLPRAMKHSRRDSCRFDMSLDGVY